MSLISLFLCTAQPSIFLSERAEVVGIQQEAPAEERGTVRGTPTLGRGEGHGGRVQHFSHFHSSSWVSISTICNIAVFIPITIIQSALVTADLHGNF